MQRSICIVAFVVLLVLAGCGGSGGGREPEPFTATASKATVNQDAVAAAGYDHQRTEPGHYNTSGQLAVSGDVQMNLQYNINATTWRAVYRHSGTTPPSVFAVYSVPEVDPDKVSATINPLRGRSSVELVSLAQSRYVDMGDLRHVGNTTVMMLGTETTVSTYAATASVADDTVDVSLHMAMVKHDGDYVIAVGVHPREANARQTIISLIEAIEH